MKAIRKGDSRLHLKALPTLTKIRGVRGARGKTQGARSQRGVRLCVGRGFRGAKKDRDSWLGLAMSEWHLVKTFQSKMVSTPDTTGFGFKRFGVLRIFKPCETCNGWGSGSKEAPLNQKIGRVTGGSESGFR